MFSIAVAWACSACTPKASYLALIAAISTWLPAAAFICSSRSRVSFACRLAKRVFSRSVSSFSAASWLAAIRSSVSLLMAAIAAWVSFSFAMRASASFAALSDAAFAASACSFLSCTKKPSLALFSLASWSWVSLMVSSAASATSSGSNTRLARPPVNFSSSPKSLPSASPTISTVASRVLRGRVRNLMIP